MKPLVETVRISKQGKEILSKIKRRTGLDRWNDISRVALFYSLANPTMPGVSEEGWDSAIEMEWKTFSGGLGEEILSCLALRAMKDRIDILAHEEYSKYFRSHLERGIRSLQNIKDLSSLLHLISGKNLNS